MKEVNAAQPSALSTVYENQLTSICNDLSAQTSNGSGVGQESRFHAWLSQQCQSQGINGLLNTIETDQAAALAMSGDQLALGLYCEFAAQNAASVANNPAESKGAAYCPAAGTAPVVPPQPTGIVSWIGKVWQDPSVAIVPTNSWLGYVGGVYVTIWAGSQSSEQLANGTEGNPSIGVVAYTVPSPDGEGFSVESVDTNSTDGALTITSVTNDVATLTAQDGTNYQFNLVTETLTKD
ncbi:MAG: hypothetical protein ACP5OV_01550 [Acidimicrobiales bacterium]